jgi:hypothetical protein
MRGGMKIRPQTFWLIKIKIVVIAISLFKQALGGVLISC